MRNYINLTPFRFWCQKVLPLVYDDSLSYYELLCKVVDYLNMTMEDVDMLHDEVVETVEAFNELKTWVEDYFTNLDVQDEINNKLDTMAQDGSLDTIINQNLFSTFNQRLNTLYDTKRSKNDTDYVTMEMLTNEVKTAMTGGSVAIVGENSVDTENIVDSAVSRLKLDVNSRNVYFAHGATVTIDTTEHTATFDGVIVIGNKRYTISNYTIPTVSTLTFVWAVPNDENNTAEIRFSNIVVSDAIFIGTTLSSIMNLVPSIYTVVDGVRSHTADEGWTNNTYNIPLGMNTPLRMLKFDFNTLTLTIPTGFTLKNNNKNFQVSAGTLSIPTGLSYLCINDDNVMSFRTGSIQANNYIIVAFVNQSVNYVNCAYPHTVVTDDDIVYSTMPEIALFGDSITAGAGATITFQNIVAHETGIQLLNYGIGSTGYLKTVPINSEHLVGTGTIGKGEMTIVDYADNNIEARIEDNIANIEQNYIAIFAGINDLSTYSVNQIVTSMSHCIDTIYNAGKIPIIIAPFSSQNTDTSTLVDAMESECKNKNVPFINLNNIGLYPTNTYNRAKYYADGLHPSNEGALRIAMKLAGALKEICIINDIKFGIR